MASLRRDHSSTFIFFIRLFSLATKTSVLSGLLIFVFKSLNNHLPQNIMEYEVKHFGSGALQVSRFDTGSRLQDVQRDPKIILLWTKFFGNEDYEVGLGEDPFISAKCDRNTFRCLTTRDRKRFNHSDAVIFHARDLNLSDLPPPLWRQSQQKYIFFNLESPIHTDLPMLSKYFKKYFNWTMTYRRDSDIVNLQSYGQLVCVEPAELAVSSSCRCYPFGTKCLSSVVEKNAKPNVASNSIRTNWIGKNKTVAWFVSNCKTDSAREALVRNLMNYIDIDVYGKCPGSLQCDDRMACNKMLEENYRFYLSFENSVCPDYVTEKLYRALAYNTIPVVFGGADYTQYLPLGSYINVKDYPNPHELASHLREVMEDDVKYTSYFRWKSSYKVDERGLQGWCQLCELLHKSKGRKVYSDIASWWYRTSGNQTCTSQLT